MSALFLCSTLLTYPLPHSAARAQECFAVTEGVLCVGASKSEQSSQTKIDAPSVLGHYRFCIPTSHNAGKLTI